VSTLGETIGGFNMRTNRAHIVAVVLGATVLATTLLGGAAASGANTPAGGTVQIYSPQLNGVHGTIVITGAIGDYGKTTTINQNGKPDSNGNFVKILLHKGTFEINSTAFNAETKNLQPTVYTSTCSAVGSATGAVTVFDGTGLYAGISGTVNITATFGFIGPLFKSGKNKGQCNLSSNSQPVSEYTLITGSGTVSFG
jgi:hypothetical protein